MCPFGKCIWKMHFSKMHAKKYFPLSAVWPHMLVEDLMLIESDSVQFLLLSPCVSIVPSSWTKARETREQKTGNGSTCTASLWKRQHLHCASLASQFCTGKPNSLHQRKSRNCGASICARDNTSQRSWTRARHPREPTVRKNTYGTSQNWLGGGITLLSK